MLSSRDWGKALGAASFRSAALSPWEPHALPGSSDSEQTARHPHSRQKSWEMLLPAPRTSGKWYVGTERITGARLLRSFLLREKQAQLPPSLLLQPTATQSRFGAVVTRQHIRQHSTGNQFNQTLGLHHSFFSTTSSAFSKKYKALSCTERWS